MADDTTATTATTDEPKKPEPPTLAELSGVNQADALAAIHAMNKRFDDMSNENGQLKRMIAAQQIQIENMKNGKAAARFGNVEIQQIHCNTCGAEVKEGGRCLKHKSSKVNYIGMGMHHNRMQPILIRQA